ncbi:MAG TPA: type II toxin-antitoxin system VapC family toxin [Myxococcales bacterium]|jgi:hypothetical protein
MIIPDVNLLLYAHDEGSPAHATASRWWLDLAERSIPVRLPWAVAMGFVRIATNPKIQRVPLPPSEALDLVDDWLRLDHVRMLDPGPRHLLIVRQLLEAAGVAASLTSDAHLAALAIEHQCELHSNDADFTRFPGLRWFNPLA